MQFLTFRLTNSVLVLAKSSVVSAAFKPSPAGSPAKGLRVVVEDQPDSALWTLRIPDLATRRLEYEDPDEPGVIRFKVVAVENAEFMVRAPYFKEARSVAVFGEAAAAARGAGAAASTQTLVLRATLPAVDAP